jgi:hypothetical protein
MLTFRSIPNKRNALHRHQILRGDDPLSYREVLQFWAEDEDFRWSFTASLADSPSLAYRWELPPVTRQTIDRPFEFVLLEAPELDRPPEPQAFAAHFGDDGADEGVVSFANLGGDAILVAPAPRGPHSAYAHLAAFMRHGPEAQQHALWRVVARAMQARLSDRPVWLSTAGMGVAWLHVRLDDRPKYYGHQPYRQWP